MVAIDKTYLREKEYAQVVEWEMVTVEHKNKKRK